MSDTDDTEDTKPLHPAQIAKLEAETRLIEARITAEQTKANAEASKNDAEAKKALVEVKLFEQNAQAGQLNLRQMERQEKAALAQDMFHKVYFFNDDVSERSVVACKDRLTFWSRTEPGCDIEIIFSSPGGSVFDGLVLFDFIQMLCRDGVDEQGNFRPKHNITTGTMGMAASMAGILLQAGSTRYIAREAWLMIHEISTLAWGKSSAIEDEVLFLKRVQKRVIDIFLTGQKKAIAAGTTHTKPMTVAGFEKEWKRKDWWLDSDEALKLGFVDEVR